MTPTYTDTELLDHLLKLSAYDEAFVMECPLCEELLRRLDVLDPDKRQVEAHRDR